MRGSQRSRRRPSPRAAVRPGRWPAPARRRRRRGSASFACARTVMCQSSKPIRCAFHSRAERGDATPAGRRGRARRRSRRPRARPARRSGSRSGTRAARGSGGTAALVPREARQVTHVHEVRDEQQVEPPLLDEGREAIGACRPGAHAAAGGSTPSSSRQHLERLAVAVRPLARDAARGRGRRAPTPAATPRARRRPTGAPRSRGRPRSRAHPGSRSCSASTPPG